MNDPSTGLPSTTYDPTGIATTHKYDLMGRLTCSAPETGHGAGLKVVYSPASWAAQSLAEVEVSERVVSNPAACTLATTTLSRQTQSFDELGRPTVEQRLMPNGVWAKRRTDYDAMSRVTHRYEWTTSTHQHSTKYKSYDAFGRPRRVDSPDGGIVTMQYNGDRLVSRTYRIGTAVSGTGTVATTAATTVEHYDREGLLRQVVPPAASGTASAFYIYDVGNRLARAELTGGGVTQTRTFNYDGRGFLTSENHPEASRVDYVSYDARGLLLRRIQSGGADITHVYDGYDRLTQVRETGGRLLKFFAYGADNLGTDRRLGKVVTATRHNYVRLPWATATEVNVQVTENHVYAGVGGRLSKRTTSVASGHTYFGGESFDTTWAYDPRGEVSSVTYPRCTHSICDVAGTGDTNRTVSFGYDQGWLESIYGYGTLTLHPNGMVHRVDHSNSRRDVYTADPYGMARPSNVQVVDSVSGGVIVDLGLHQYDPVGNLMTRGGERYHYDLAGRLVRYQAAGGGYQVYGFDGFGNLTSTYKSALGGTVTYVTSATTNRLASGTYDGAGNLLSLSPHSQIWDPLDTLMQRGQQEETYLYTASDERLYAGVANANRTIQKMASETWTLRDRGGAVLTAYATNGGRSTGAWSWQQDYVYRGNAVLASVRPGIVHHYTLDHLGTPRATWGPTGQLVVARSYWGFGEDMSASDTDPEKKRFTGHERDTRGAGTADDLDYMHARYYSPMWGRFLSVDPARSGEATQPQTWNRYSYVSNDPLNLIDPTGRYGETPLDVGVLVFDLIIAAVEQHRDGRVSETTRAAITADLLTLVTPGAAGGGVVVRAGAAAVKVSDGARAAAEATRAVTKVAQVAEMSGDGGSSSDGARNPAQDRKLSPGEIRKLKDSDIDVHALKGGKKASRYDLFKDRKGNLYVKPKSGAGAGEATGYNIYQLRVY